MLDHNIWTIFPEEMNGTFYQYYHEAMASGKAVHFEAYYGKKQLWLEVKAFPSQEGLSVLLMSPRGTRPRLARRN